MQSVRGRAQKRHSLPARKDRGQGIDQLAGPEGGEGSDPAGGTRRADAAAARRLHARAGGRAAPSDLLTHPLSSSRPLMTRDGGRAGARVAARSTGSDRRARQLGKRLRRSAAGRDQGEPWLKEGWMCVSDGAPCPFIVLDEGEGDGMKLSRGERAPGEEDGQA